MIARQERDSKCAVMDPVLRLRVAERLLATLRPQPGRLSGSLLGAGHPSGGCLPPWRSPETWVEREQATGHSALLGTVPSPWQGPRRS